MAAERQTEKICVQLVSKAALSPDDTELYELTQLAGLTMDQQVFKIILDLLKLNVPPVAIIQILRSMCSPHKLGSSVTEHSLTSLDASPARGENTGGQADVTQQSGRQLKTGSRDRQDISSSRDHLARASSSYSQDVSSSSALSSGKSNRDSSYAKSRSHSQLTFDTTSGRNDSRSQDSQLSQSSFSRADSFVTTRQLRAANLEDYDSYKNKENISKKTTFN